jgi:hypothetical protein
MIGIGCQRGALGLGPWCVGHLDPFKPFIASRSSARHTMFECLSNHRAYSIPFTLPIFVPHSCRAK